MNESIIKLLFPERAAAMHLDDADFAAHLVAHRGYPPSLAAGVIDHNMKMYTLYKQVALDAQEYMDIQSTRTWKRGELQP